MQDNTSSATPLKGRSSDAARSRSAGGTPVLAGVISGIDNVGFSIALASLMFAGPLASGLGLAASAALVGTAVLGLTLAAASGLRGTVGTVQDIGVAVLAPALAGMAAAGTLSTEVAIATALAIVALSSLATGGLMFLTGYLGLGRLVRFFPQTVVAGFLAGTGWLLIVSGIAVAASLPMGSLFSVEMWDATHLTRVAPALGFALALWLVLPRVKHPATWAALLLTGVAGFYVVLGLSGETPAAAQAGAWLPATPPTDSLFDLVHFIPLIDWPTVNGALPVIGIVAVLSLLASLINTSALDTVKGQEVDQNRELRITGLANIVVGAAAGPPGYSDLASSLVVNKISPDRRAAGIVAACVAVIGLLAAPLLVSTIPVFVTSGLIIYLGADLLRTWLVDTRKRYSNPEWIIVLAIVIVVAVAGFAPALIAGLIIGVALFVFTYARVPVVRRVLTLDRMHSSRERDPHQAALLRKEGAAVAVFELQGFLFFGTAERLRTQLKDRLADTNAPQLKRLILDFGHVTGVDSAALVLIDRIATMTADLGIVLVLSRARSIVSDALTRTVPHVLTASHVQQTATLDEAVEAAEEVLLGAPVHSVPPAEMAARYAMPVGDTDRLAVFFASVPAERVPPGTKVLVEGTPADGLVLIEEGVVTVRRQIESGGPSQRLRAMGAGSILGDIGLATGAPRSADVVAETEVVLRRISATSLASIETDDPGLALALSRVVMRALADKIVTGNRIAEGNPV